MWNPIELEIKFLQKFRMDLLLLLKGRVRDSQMSLKDQ